MIAIFSKGFLFYYSYSAKDKKSAHPTVSGVDGETRLRPSYLFHVDKRSFVASLICIAKCITFCHNIEKRRKSMLFEWDESKEKRNIVKHGLDFSTAALIFHDVNRLEWFDERHSEQEDRYITIGEIGGTAVVVMVVYTERLEVIRIISARKATNAERRAYYDSKRD
jgi:hypothetical protein